MPVTVCWAAKGGSGTTVVTAALALFCPTESLLVDLAGELPIVLGLGEPPGHGVADWLQSDAPAAALDDLAVEVGDTTRLIARGTASLDRTSARWAELREWLVAQDNPLVDAGTGVPPAELLGDGVRSLLVTRACYLSLRRAVDSRCRPDGIVLVVEPGRQYRPFDVERMIGAPVVATVSQDPAIARAVDVGLLRARPPRTFTRELRGAAA